MGTIKDRLLVLEQRRGAPAGTWPELIVLCGDEAMTPHQIGECGRAARNNLPTLTVRIERNNHGNA